MWLYVTEYRLRTQCLVYYFVADFLSWIVTLLRSYINGQLDCIALDSGKCHLICKNVNFLESPTIDIQ